jgi:hypothetical protein
MSRRKSPPALGLATAMMLASWETILHRGRLMATGRCSPAEYRRMWREKARAAAASAGAAAIGDLRGALAPWAKRAAANAKRLRRRR